MAEESSDIKINIGAETDLSGAGAAVVAEFSKMEERLQRVGTAQAKELAKQLRTVTQGLREGAFKAEDVESVGEAFAQIKEDAQLSDEAIKSLSSHLSTAQRSSRQLADHFARVEKHEQTSKRLMDGLSGAIDDIAPEADGIVQSFGKWANRIPGVTSLLGKMGAAAGPIALAFKAVTAAVLMAIKSLKEYQTIRRNAVERQRSIREENMENDLTNAFARIDREAQKRQMEMEDRRAIEDVQLEIANNAARRDMYTAMLSAVDDESRAGLERRTTREIEDNESNVKTIRLQEDAEENAKKVNDGEKKLAELTEKRATLSASLLQIEQEKEKYERMRSAKVRDIEQELRLQGLTEGSAEYEKTLSERVTDWMSSTMEDWTKNLLSTIGVNDVGALEGEELFKKRQDEERQRRQTLAELDNQIKQFENQQSSLRRAGTLIAEQQKAQTETVNVREAQRKDEDNLRNRQREWQLRERRFDLMGQGNRLTAMGLGGGNAALDTGKEIAKEAKEIHALLKEHLKGAVRKGIAGDNSMNGPHLAPQAHIGDFGGLGWGI